MWRSEYSDISNWISASESPKRNAASVRESSVLPTPDGPAKINEPPGRRGSLSPARVRRMACESALMACSCPITRRWSSSSILSRRAVSSSVNLNTGIPVAVERTSAINSSSTSVTTSRSPAFHDFSRSARSAMRFFSSSRSDAAFSKSWLSIADSFSRRVFAIFSSNALSSGGAVMRRMRRREPASSMRSIALSGKKRSAT